MPVNDNLLLAEMKNCGYTGHKGQVGGIEINLQTCRSCPAGAGHLSSHLDSPDGGGSRSMNRTAAVNNPSPVDRGSFDHRYSSTQYRLF